MGRSSFTAFGRIDTRQFLKNVFFATARLFKAHFVSVLHSDMHAHSPGHHKPRTQRRPSTLPLLKILSASTLSETLVRAFAGHCPSSSASLVVSHDDALSAPSSHISLYKSRSDSEYAADTTSYCRHEMLAAFHFSPQILHLPYTLREFSVHHRIIINH